jgi:hypothetical protein
MVESEWQVDSSPVVGEGSAFAPGRSKVDQTTNVAKTNTRMRDGPEHGSGYDSILERYEVRSMKAR